MDEWREKDKIRNDHIRDGRISKRNVCGKKEWKTENTRGLDVK